MQRHFNWFCFITHILYQWIAIFLVSDLPALFLAKPCSEGVFVIFIACGDRRSPITGNQPISAVSIVARWPRNGEAQASWGHQRAWPAAERNKWQEPQIVEPQQDMHSMRGRIASYCVKPWDGQKGIHPCLVGIIGGHGSCNCSLSSVENQSYHLLQGGSRTDKHRRHRLPGVTSVRGQQLKETNRRSPRLWSHSKTCTQCEAELQATVWSHETVKREFILVWLGSLVVTEAATAASRELRINRIACCKVAAERTCTGGTGFLGSPACVASR